jgi:hypothetical protein
MKIEYPASKLGIVSRYEELQAAKEYGIPFHKWIEGMSSDEKALVVAHRRVSMLESSHRRDIEIVHQERQRQK